MAEIKLKIASVVIGSGEGGGSGVAPYYADLPDKPSINGETLSGDMTSEDLGLASESQAVPSGGTTGQVLAKKSNADNDVQWVNQQSGGQGTTDYADLENKPKINNVTLSGNKTTSQLGLQAELVSGTNIKTINNQSIVGSGNITIEGGGTEVEANPTGEATTPLNKIKIGETNYNIPQTDTSNLATKQELQQGLSGKQDIISDLQQIRTRADEGHTALQPVQDVTPNNFASFNSTGALQDSQCNEDTFIKGVQQNGVDLQKDVNGKVNVTVQDGKDGLSAFEIAQQQGYPGTVDQWLASLKANIGEFLFVPTDAAAVTAMGAIGQTYSSAIDPQGKNVSPTQNTLSVILLMNDDATTPSKTMMIATQEVTPATTPASYEFVYAGDLQSAISSNVVTTDKIDNDFAGGNDKVASAEEAKKLSLDVIGGIDASEKETINANTSAGGGLADNVVGYLRLDSNNNWYWQGSSGGGSTGFIDISNASITPTHIRIKANSRQSQISFLKAKLPTGSNITQATLKSTYIVDNGEIYGGYSRPYHVVPSNENRNITIPEGTNFIGVRLSYSTYNYTPLIIELLNGTEVIGIIEKVGDIEQLETSSKASVTDAINEVNENINAAFSEVGYSVKLTDGLGSSNRVKTGIAGKKMYKYRIVCDNTNGTSNATVYLYITKDGSYSISLSTTAGNISSTIYEIYKNSPQLYVSCDKSNVEITIEILGTNEDMFPLDLKCIGIEQGKLTGNSAGNTVTKFASSTVVRLKQKIPFNSISDKVFKVWFANIPPKLSRDGQDYSNYSWRCRCYFLNSNGVALSGVGDFRELSNNFANSYDLFTNLNNKNATDIWLSFAFTDGTNYAQIAPDDIPFGSLRMVMGKDYSNVVNDILNNNISNVANSIPTQYLSSRIDVTKTFTGTEGSKIAIPNLNLSKGVEYIFTMNSPKTITLKLVDADGSTVLHIFTGAEYGFKKYSYTPSSDIINCSLQSYIPSASLNQEISYSAYPSYIDIQGVDNYFDIKELRYIEHTGIAANGVIDASSVNCFYTPDYYTIHNGEIKVKVNPRSDEKTIKWRVAYYDKDKVFLSATSNYETPSNKTTSTNARFFRLSLLMQDNGTTISSTSADLEYENICITFSEDSLTTQLKKVGIKLYDSELINSDSDKAVLIKASKQAADNYGLNANGTNFPTLFITTDIHSQWNYPNWYNILEHTLLYGNTNDDINVMLMLGDLDDNPNTLGNKNWKQLVLSQNKPLLSVAGNHELYKSTEWTNPGQFQGFTDETLFDYFYSADTINKCGEIHGGENNDKPYYYKDLDAITYQANEEGDKVTKTFKLRLICLYQYEYVTPTDQTTGAPLNNWKNQYKVYSQEQIDWLLDVLDSCDANTHVMVIAHEPICCGMKPINNDWNCITPPYIARTEVNNMSDNLIIPKIIDAWVNGTTVQTTCNMKVGNPLSTYTTVNVNHTFQSAHHNKFVCYLGGHIHADYIVAHDSYPEQIQILITCTNNLSTQQNGELYRGSGKHRYSGTTLTYIPLSKTLRREEPTKREIRLIHIGADKKYNMREQVMTNILLDSY